MNQIMKDPLLSIARTVLLAFQALLVMGGALLIAGIGIAIIRPTLIFDELVDKVPIQPGMTEAWLFAGCFAIVLVFVVLLILFFRHMRRIVDTVADGDPFIPINANRLTSMAWLMLTIQILTIPAGVLMVELTNRLGEDPSTVGVGVDLNGLVLVLTLFILARVFGKGSEMRDDLEGTV